MTNWMERVVLVIAATGAVLGLCVTQLQAQNTGRVAAGQKPNIVFILVDNVGWGAFGAYGGMIPTPRIDKLASEGIRFNNYNVEAQCTPTRSAITDWALFGSIGDHLRPLSPDRGSAGWRHGNTPSPNFFPTQAMPLHCTASGIWVTHKADCRMTRASTSGGASRTPGTKRAIPHIRYSRRAGLPAPMLYEGKKGEPSKPVMPLDLNVRPIVDEKYIIPKTVDYIKRNAAAKKPFFVYVGYSEAHAPYIPNPNFAGKSSQRGGVYADIIGEMDYRVGQILDAIKEAGIDDNTIVVLSSDNASGGGLIRNSGEVPTGPGAVISLTRRSREACGCLR